MQSFSTLIPLVLLVSACSSPTLWQSDGTIGLGNVTPIGLTVYQGNLWIADGDHNQVVEIRADGTVQQTLGGFERPMHLSSDTEALYVPEYGSDQIVQMVDGKRTLLNVPDSLDAPAGVSVYSEEVAIADFYHHQIVYFDGKDWTRLGQEGHGSGELYYPTDVQITDHEIFVADAYNHRVQVLNKQQRTWRTVGEADEMNATTGLFATAEQLLVTDFENNRVLVYDHAGNLVQTITEDVHKPTDLLEWEGVLYVANYGSKSLLRLVRE